MKKMFQTRFMAYIGRGLFLISVLCLILSICIEEKGNIFLFIALLCSFLANLILLIKEQQKM